MKKLAVIARYNEDISWTRDLDCDIFIYNKGTDWKWDDIPRLDIENYGRETETYVRAIIEFYELLDDYDVMIFCQGNPFDHYDFPVQSINNCKPDSIQFLANSVVTYTTSKLINFFNVNNFVISKLFNKEIIYDASFTNLHGEKVVDETRGHEVVSTVLFTHILGLKMYENGILYPAGAQYVVPTSYLKLKKLEWWVQLYELIQAWKFLVPDDDIGAYFERTWPLIWIHEPKD
jgi:hypothetical protein